MRSNGQFYLTRIHVIHIGNIVMILILIIVNLFRVFFFLSEYLCVMLEGNLFSVRKCLSHQVMMIPPVTPPPIRSHLSIPLLVYLERKCRYIIIYCCLVKIILYMSYTVKNIKAETMLLTYEV